MNVGSPQGPQAPHHNVPVLRCFIIHRLTIPLFGGRSMQVNAARKSESPDGKDCACPYSLTADKSFRMNSVENWSDGNTWRGPPSCPSINKHPNRR